MKEEVIGSIKTTTYEFTLSELAGFLVCHIDIFKWNSGVYKEMLTDFRQLRDDVEGDIHCCINKQNKKSQKVASLFGFYPKLETEDKIIMGL